MASYRRYDPRADERAARVAKAMARVARDKARLHRLLKLVRKVPLKGAEAQAAWGQKLVRTFSVAYTSNESYVDVLLRTDGENLFLQEPGNLGWHFFRLVPKHHVLRREEESEGRDPSKKGSLRKRFKEWHARAMREKREDLQTMGENVMAVTRAVAGGGAVELRKLKTVRTPIGGFQLGSGGKRDPRRRKKKRARSG